MSSTTPERTLSDVNPDRVRVRAAKGPHYARAPPGPIVGSFRTEMAGTAARRLLNLRELHALGSGPRYIYLHDFQIPRSGHSSDRNVRSRKGNLQTRQKGASPRA